MSIEELQSFLTKSFGRADSFHGPSHWQRVKAYGLYICQHTGADSEVVSLFAFFHDSQRQNEDYDPGHGARAAEYVRSIRHEIPLQNNQVELLMEACAGHTDILYHDNPTIAACWDADRLDLDRVGITPDPKRVNIEVAKRLCGMSAEERRERCQHFISETPNRKNS